MTYKILIVDDSKLARMSVIKILAAHYPDWPRMEAGTADEAMTLAKDNVPDVAVLDFNMPQQSGLELAAQLRQLQPAMPIAVVSANHQQEVVDRAQSLGAIFLPKPLREDALKSFLAEAVQGLKAGRS